MANKDKLLESAQKFLAKGQLPKAIGEYQKLIEAFPKDFRNRQKLAELLSREKRNDEAQPHYEAVAKNFTETGFYLKSIAIYKQMQKIEPNRVDLYLRLAELNEKQGLIGNALNEYRSLIAFYEKNRMMRESVGVLQKMISLDSENLGVRSKLIETLATVGEQEGALEQLLALIRLLTGKGEHAKVVKLYEKFLDLCPEDIDNRLPLAMALLSSGQTERALSLLKNLLKLAPDHPPLLLALTDCHLALGNHADARLTCQHLLKEQPQDLGLRERYIRICMAGADHERALECLEESKETFAQAGRGGILKELYETLQSALPDNARLQATLAAIYDTTDGDMARPVLAAATRITAVEGETSDAAVLDAAIDDVEQLALAGEAVAPPVEVPPLDAPVPSAKPVNPAGGLELELDLDLELDLSTAVPPSTAPASVVPAPAAPVVAPSPQPVVSAPEPAPLLEMELEFDLGDLEGLDTAPPIAERVISSDPAEPVEAASQPPPAPEVAVDLEPGPVSPVQPAPEAVSEPDVDGLSLPDFGELEFEQEQEQEQKQELSSIIPEAGEPLAEVVVTTETPIETAPTPVEPTGGAEFEVEFAIDESVEEPSPVVEVVSSATASAEEPEIINGFADVEVIEDLDEVEELIENDEFFVVEVSDKVEELAAVEELDEVEPLEELEDLDELDEIEEETEPVVEEMLSGSSQQLRDDLEEAEFYLRQGLLDDAERVLQDLQQHYAGLPEVTAMLVEIEAQRQTIAQAGEEGALFDLMADINDSELLGATAFLDDSAGGTTDEFSLEEAAEDDEDTQSHFDLGIAYKEMGLLDDAIAEFGKAVRDPSRQLDCLTLKGQCQIDMGDIDKAEATYKEGLALPNLTEEGMVALRYELGLLYEAAGRPLESLESFQFVADRDLFYRDVTDKLKLLRQKLGIDDHAIEAVSEGGSGRDRISFV